MRDSRCVMLLLAMAVLSGEASAGAQTSPRATTPRQTTARPAPKPTPRVTGGASSRDPFIGVWNLSAAKSKYESGGAPPKFTRTYEDRGGGTIFMITDAAGTQGPVTRAYLVYRRDGKAYPEAAVGVSAVRMATVRAVNPRTEQVTFTDGASEITGTITVSADGRTMTQVLNGRNAKGRAFTNTLVFDKQP